MMGDVDAIDLIAVRAQNGKFVSTCKDTQVNQGTDFTTIYIAQNSNVSIGFS